MKRSGPLERHTPLQAREPWRPERKRLRQRSAKREREHRTEYLPLVAELVAEDDRCEVGPLLAAVDPSWRGCWGRADGLHHLRKQGQGGARTDRENVLRSCNPCNQRVEDRPYLAHEAGLVRRAGDPLP